MEKNNLHKKQKKILEILKINPLNPPTLEEMGRKCNISAPSIVFHHLKQLEKKGYIRKKNGKYKILDITKNDLEKLENEIFELRAEIETIKDILKDSAIYKLYKFNKQKTNDK
jgi:predicted transcriptional regulator